MPRPPDAADTGEAVAAMGNERIDERAVGVAGCGVNHQPGWLVDNDDVSILVSDRERNDFALRLSPARAAEEPRCTLSAGLTLGPGSPWSPPVPRHARTGSGPEGASGSYPAAARTGLGPALPRVLVLRGHGYGLPGIDGCLWPVSHGFCSLFSVIVVGL